MLERNMRIKEKPQRFQGTKERFDVIISCEGKVYDQIIEGVIHVKKACRRRRGGGLRRTRWRKDSEGGMELWTPS